LLEGLGQAALDVWESNPIQIQQRLEGEEGGIWRDIRLVRAVWSVTLPMSAGNILEDRPDKEGVWIASALKGLHVLSASISPVAPSASSSQEAIHSWMDLHRGISMLVQSADTLLSDESTTLKDAVEARWAIRGLVARLQLANAITNGKNEIEMEAGEVPSQTSINFSTPNLNARTSNLPFEIFPHCLPWQMDPVSSVNHYYGYPTKQLLPDLLLDIPFNFDTLTTRTGNEVIERRGTAWLAEGGIGALAYSGKLMRPAEVPALVREIMREMEQWCVEQGRQHADGKIAGASLSLLPSCQMMNSAEVIWDDCSSTNLAFQELGEFIQSTPEFFDCALCNHYPDGDSACKFHTDPEHGTHWHRTTAVVSCGSSRKFAFRPIPEVSTWSEWESKKKQQQNDDTSNAPAVSQLFQGDVVFMTGSCNDLFHHAVYASPSDGKLGIGNSRVSLVFKRALDRGGGKKGHGLAGEGRRSRRKNADF
jgi:hypothetical protein